MKSKLTRTLILFLTVVLTGLVYYYLINELVIPNRIRLIYRQVVPGLDQVEPQTKLQSATTAEPIVIESDEVRIRKFYRSVEQSEKKIYSQNGEDGVVLKFTQLLNLTRGYYVEFGTEDGIETNTRNLRETYNWRGLLMDMIYKSEKINLHRETITPQTILKLFAKHKVKPKGVDLLSVDTDYADYWILEKILSKYSPKIVIHEVNMQSPDVCVTVPLLNGLAVWDNFSVFYGANICAFYCLAKRFNYTMVYCENRGVNCFWLRDDLIERILNIDAAFVRRILNPFSLFKRAYLPYRDTDQKWQYLQKCFDENQLVKDLSKI